MLVKARMKGSADKDWARDAAGRFMSGTFKASQTGAKQRSEEKGRYSDMGQMAKSMTAGTKESEEYIRSGTYKKGGK
jgi:hypothetical protein